MKPLEKLLIAFQWIAIGCSAEPPPEPEVPAIPDACTTERASNDRPDDSELDQVRVLYVVPSDGPDNQYDTSNKICNSVRAAATWFHAQTGSYLRFDTSDGLVDIGFVRLDRTDAEMHGNDPSNTSDEGLAFVTRRIEIELEPLAENKLYAVFYDGTSSYACGGGSWPPMIPGRVGAMYLRAQPPGVSTLCGDVFPWGDVSLRPSYVDYGMLHELLHSMGFVRAGAIHEHDRHVFDSSSPEPERDLMYTERAGQPDPAWAVDHPDGLIMDIGNDDYFGTPSLADLSHRSLIAPLPEVALRPPGWP